MVGQFPQSRLEIVQGGMVPIIEHMPEEVAAIVTKFLDEQA